MRAGNDGECRCTLCVVVCCRELCIVLGGVLLLTPVLLSQVQLPQQGLAVRWARKMQRKKPLERKHNRWANARVLLLRLSGFEC